MLESLSIRNFQAHAHLKIEFDPHCTTIVGPSDAGKSAIIRALRWVCQNRPGGNAFVRNKQKFCRVNLAVDGKTIRRKKGAKNIYALGKKKFAAFGAGIPPEIARLLNIGDTNFQGQHDAPFWLSDSPGAVSRQLNQIVNLGAIDAALGSVAALVRKAESRVEVTRERLKAAKARRAELTWVPEFVIALHDLQAKEKAIAARRARIDALRSILADVESAQKAAAGAAEAIVAGRAAVSAGEAAGGKALQAQSLREMIDEIRHSAKNLLRAELNLETAEKEFRNKTKGKQCPVCGKIM